MSVSMGLDIQSLPALIIASQQTEHSRGYETMTTFAGISNQGGLFVIEPTRSPLPVQKPRTSIQGHHQLTQDEGRFLPVISEYRCFAKTR